MSNLNPAQYPNIPVDPQVFTSEVVQQLQNFGVFISNDMPLVIEELCGLLNYSIQNPSVGAGFQSKIFWAYPAQTGIGKSVSLKVYAASLKIEASLIVVNTKDEAKEYCDDINSIKGSAQYAHCFYTVQNKSDVHPNLLERQDLKGAQCLIITHNRLKKVLTDGSVDDIKKYDVGSGTLRDRELVVIDEQLSLYSDTNLDFQAVTNLVTFLETALTNTKNFQNKYKNIQEQINILKMIHDYLEQKKPSGVTHTYIGEGEIDKHLLKSNVKKQFYFNRLGKIAKSLVKGYFKQLRLVNKDSYSYNKKVVNELTRTINKLEKIMIYSSSEDVDDQFKVFLVYQSNNQVGLLRVKNIYNQLGTAVILDATANVDAFYKFADRGMFSRVELAPAKQIRIYKSLTIHIAKSFKQSRYAIYRKEGVVGENVKMYLFYAKSILRPGDTLLVVCHKNFKPHLEESIEKDQLSGSIKCTHWGNHVGKNKWSDCNKVMIIGWNYLNMSVTLSSVFSTGIGTDDLRVQYALNEGAVTVENFEETQLADDFIQAIMRCRARVIAAKDSDCKPADIYLFSDDSHRSKNVIQLVAGAFPQAQIKPWNLAPYQQKKKKGKIEKNADLIIDYLKANVKKGNPVFVKDFNSKLSITRSSLYRALNSSYFGDELEKNNFKKEKRNGSTDQYVLK